MIDVAEQINAVSRHVGSRVFGPGEARVSTISQTYDADVDDVWDACTSPERLPRWFLPVTGDLKVGGRYQLEGNAGGTVERCDPPKSFFATWEFNGMVSWIEVRVAPESDGGTRLELEHVAHVEDNLWSEYGPGAAGIGWDLAFWGLASYLSSGHPTMSPEEGEAWAMSPEGVGFVKAVAERWRAAHVESGADEEAARAAAQRVTAFYTTPPPAEG
ncbi:SRPBCC domain-containing protein [Actinophytocola glycyrrhizae]|uniref:SRPBCC domain-containing protein n=1 Tax=Actinophytocola glycyrrhizae TaxID=2044873 RepID=A0ABV9SAJ6_9PSEU